MAFVLNDRVKETTTTTGTGTVNLGGAATGFETFVAGVGNSNSTYYCIAGQTTAEFEVGIGTVTDASPDTLSRTTILSSSNSDSAVDFSAGTKDVFCTLPAAKTIREFDTAVNIPTGTTAQRSSSAAAGDFRYNTSTGRFEGYSSAWNALGGSNTFSTDIFAGDGSDTTFTLSQSIENENDLFVFIDGVFQAHNSYSVSGTTLTFSTAPADGRVITAYSVKSAVSGNNVTISTMDGDGSDTTLTLAADPVNENNVQVYIDGVYQNKDTFAVSGTTLTFSAAPPNGTKVEAITLTQTNINTATQLADADGDTKVQVEESSDEDTIRMDIAGTEVLTLTNSAMTLKGTTPTLTIGDAGAEDTKIVFDGNAQDYYIGLDDSADDLIIGKGSTVGTTPAVVIDENLNVGIGNTTPSNAYSLADDLVVGSTSGAHGISIIAQDNTNSALHFADALAGDDGAASYAGYLAYNHASNYMFFGTSSTERMRIDSSGNVAIGTTSVLSGNKLDVRGGNIMVGGYGGGTDYGLILTPDDSGAYFNIANIAGGNLTFNRSSTINQYEKMRIDSSGEIHVNKTATVNNGQFEVLAQANHQAIVAKVQTNAYSVFQGFNASGSAVFTATGAGALTITGSLSQGSDISLKENIKPLDNQLETVKKLNPVTFDWKENKKPYQQIGFIAQEVEKHLPELIEDKDDIKRMSYGNITAVLVKAIQEQQTLIETLQAKVEALENG